MPGIFKCEGPSEPPRAYYWTPTPKVSDSIVVLRSSQVILVVLVQGPHSETGLESHLQILMWEKKNHLEILLKCKF